MSALKITSDNFKNEVLESDVPVLLDFWAAWCGPCKMVAPILEEVAEETKETIKIGKINIDEEEELARAFHIMSIPTLLVIKDGKVVETSIGLRPKKDILSLLGFKKEEVKKEQEESELIESTVKEDREIMKAAEKTPQASKEKAKVIKKKLGRQ